MTTLMCPHITLCLTSPTACATLPCCWALLTTCTTFCAPRGCTCHLAVLLTLAYLLSGAFFFFLPTSSLTILIANGCTVILSLQGLTVAQPPTMTTVTVNVAPCSTTTP